MTLQDMLQGLASGLQVTRDGAALVSPGTPVGFHLVPPTLNLTVPTTVDGQVSLTFLTKSVRFADGLLPTGSLTDYLGDHANVIGGRPILDLTVPMQGPPLQGAVPDQTVVELAEVISTTGTTTLPVPTPVDAPLQTVQTAPGTVTTPSLAAAPATAANALSGVPGLLGQLAGTIPIPTMAPVQVSVTWQVQDQSGNALSPQPTMLGAGSDVQFVFNAVFVEADRNNPPSTTQLQVVATVTLTAGSVSVQVPLPPVPVLVPQVPVPTILVISNRTNFGRGIVGDDDSALMVAVPDRSPLATVTDLSTTLTALSTTLHDLTSVAGAPAAAVGLLTGVGTLQAVLSAWSPTGDEYPLPMVRGDSIDPHDVSYGPTTLHNLFSPDNFDDEDRSALLLGVPGMTASLHDNEDGTGRTLRLTPGDAMWVVVPDLSHTGSFQPSGTPPLADPTVTPGGDFHDSLELITFDHA